MKYGAIFFILVTVTLIGSAGCNQQHPPDEKKTPNESQPTKEELLEYLDGKSVPMQGLGPDGFGLRYVLKKDRIEAVEFGNSASSQGGRWTTEVYLIFDTGSGRYTVICDVEHRLVEHKRAFFAFTPKTISTKQ